MNFCPKCRKKLVVQDFCVECGADLSEFLNSNTASSNSESDDIFDFSLLEKAKQERLAINKAQWEVGGHPIFGAGPDGDIEWTVLAREGNKALIITKNCLCEKPYHNSFPYEGTTWEKCDLRRWLNTVFSDAYFILKDGLKILYTTRSTSDHPIAGTSGGNPTRDKVFLLSIEEAEKYFKNGLERSNDNRWWLRSPGNEPYYAAVVDGFGEILMNGDSIDNPYYGVRPAMWVDAEAIIAEM